MKWLVVIVVLAGCAVERELPACTDCVAQGVHPEGFAMNHRTEIERRGYDLAVCQRCHGEDFAGKASAPSCLSCHTKGPTACDTCHGNPPTTGAHTPHLTRGFACTECHVVPATWNAPNHFTQRAVDPATGKCSNGYCHGDARPTWTGGSAQATCGSCHGNPPASHVQTQCANCHPTTTHVDGKLDIGNGNGTCSACHGDAESPAPATGAHRAHLRGGYFSGPIACSACHVVPATVTAPGHIDSAPPAELTLPGWNAAAGTCSNVYCHGASTPSWTGTAQDNAYCGSCHGLPPQTPAHNPAMTLMDCATCHPASVSPYGGILVGNGKHINGVIDAQ